MGLKILMNHPVAVITKMMTVIMEINPKQSQLTFLQKIILLERYKR